MVEKMVGVEAISLYCTVHMMSLEEERREEIRIGEEAAMCFYPSQEATQLISVEVRVSWWAQEIKTGTRGRSKGQSSQRYAMLDPCAARSKICERHGQSVFAAHWRR